jgi:CRISPR/Cas system-associated exonuclease Cas4 (RecB family)
VNGRVLPTGTNIVAEAASLLEPRGQDFSGNLVVFPGRRPAHFLRREIALRTGGAFIPPVIHSIDGFVDELYDASFERRKIDMIDAVAVMYHIHCSAEDRIGHDRFLSLDRFFSIGMTIFRDLEELHIEGVRGDLVRQVDPEAVRLIPEGSLARLQSLSWFYDRFYAELESAGLSTRSSRYRAVAAMDFDAALGRYRRKVFAGFFALTKTEKEIFRKLGLSDNTVFLFQQGRGLSAHLKDFNVGAGDAEAEEETAEKVSFYRSPDIHGQIFALSRLFGQERPDERTAVVLPSSDALFPLLRQGLIDMTEDDYNISMGYPLRRTPIFGFLENLMGLVSSMDRDRVYLPAYLNFVLHPYTKNIFFRGKPETTRVLFHTIEEVFSENASRTFMTMKEIESTDEIMGRAAKKLGAAGEEATPGDLREHLRQIHHATIGRFLSFASVADFAAECLALLTFIYDNSSARLHPLFQPFAEAFVRTMGELSGSLLSGFSFADRESYFSLFRKCVAASHVPFDGTPVRGLQVLGLLETRGLSFDRVIVLNANEETLPATRRDDTLLPLKARQYLGLPTYIDRDRIADYNFSTLLGSAREVHIFSVESDTQERSRFVERLLWRRQKRDRKTEVGDYVASVQYRVSLGNSGPQPVEKTQQVLEFLKGYAFSPTALDLYLGCPLEFYYSQVLRISRTEAVTGEIARTEIGRSVHDILDTYFSTLRGIPLTERDIDTAVIERLCRDHFAVRYGRDLVGAQYLLANQTARQLRAFLEQYYLPLIRETRVRIIETEKRMQTGFEGFRLKGRVDCVEERDGRTYIIDYKTGASDRMKVNFAKLDPADRGTWTEAIGSLQLPCYLMIYAGEKAAAPETLNGAYLLLGRSVIGRDIELPLFADGDRQAGCQALRQVIRLLLEEITDPSVPFTPSADVKRQCPDCDFRYICGNQHIAARR